MNDLIVLYDDGPLSFSAVHGMYSTGLSKVLEGFLFLKLSSTM